MFEIFYFLVIAFTAQISTQAPQSVHLAASIWYLPSSASEMALTLQIPSQAPQEMQVSLSILWGINLLLKRVFCYN